MSIWSCAFLDSPLLGVTWPEILRGYLNNQPPEFLGDAAKDALEQLKTSDYVHLVPDMQIALLDALLHAAADTEVARRCAQFCSLQTRLRSLP